MLVFSAQPSIRLHPVILGYFSFLPLHSAGDGKRCSSSRQVVGCSVLSNGRANSVTYLTSIFNLGREMQAPPSWHLLPPLTELVNICRHSVGRVPFVRPNAPGVPLMPHLWRLDNSKSIGPGNFRIPKRLHFLWGFLGDDGSLADREQKNFDRWKMLNPQWQMTVQSPKSVLPVVNNHDRQKLYHGVPTAIQRCDLARPLLLEKYGGVYSDLDVQPFRSLDWLCGLFPTANVILVEEVTLTRASSRRRGNRFPNSPWYTGAATASWQLLDGFQPRSQVLGRCAGVGGRKTPSGNS